MTGLGLTSVEVLETRGNGVTARAAQLDAFTTLTTFIGATSGTVTMTVAASGVATTMDLAAALDTRSAVLQLSADNETLTTGAGNDVILSSTDSGDDVLDTGAGNDRISLAIVRTAAIDVGAGNDDVDIGSAAALGGSVNGGDGQDTLAAGNIASLSVTGFEVFSTRTPVLGFAAQFESFDTIRASAANLDGLVTLNLAATGAATTLNLVGELTNGAGFRAVRLSGSSDFETLVTGGGDDTVSGQDGNDVLSGGAGNDLLSGDAGDDALLGGDGNDTLTDTRGTSTFLDGGSGDDELILSDQTLRGQVFGGVGIDSLSLGIGNQPTQNITGLVIDGIETLQTGGKRIIATAAQLADFSSILAGSILDFVHLILQASGAPQGLDLAEALGPQGRVLLIGSTDNEALSGGSGGDTIVGGGGRDVLIGNAGDDDLDGGLGSDDDQLIGGRGNDTLTGLGGNDALFGGTGNDSLTGNGLFSLMMTGDGGDDLVTIVALDTNLTGFVSGGTGNDILRLDGGTMNLATLGIAGFETLETQGSTVAARASQLATFGTIRASAALPGDAVTLTLLTSGGQTVLNLAPALTGGTGRSVTLTGSTDAERVTLGARDDKVNAGAGDDTIVGGAGNDVLLGAAGNDSLVGGDKDDVLCGGALADDLTGGAGSDRFWFAEHLAADADVVRDFTTKTDKILISRADFGQFDKQGSVVVPATDWFAANTTGNAQDASDRFIYNRLTGQLFFDSDGTGIQAKVVLATFSAGSGGLPLLAATDFVLQNTIDFEI